MVQDGFAWFCMVLHSFAWFYFSCNFALLVFHSSFNKVAHLNTVSAISHSVGLEDIVFMGSMGFFWAAVPESATGGVWREPVVLQCCASPADT